MRSAVGVLAAAVALAAGCARGPAAVDFPEPPPPQATSTSTTTPDYRGVVLPPVPGVTTTTALVPQPGRAGVSGTVDGPLGPVPDAVVRVERLVGDQVQTTDVRSRADGTWRLANVAGGRYRVRAWRAPDLTSGPPAVLFLGGDERRKVPLVLQLHVGTVVTSSVAPNSPQVGLPAAIGVAVANRRVDAAGVVRADPVVPGLVLLQGPGVRVTSPNPVVTDGRGRASWEFVCITPGAPQVIVFVGLLSYPVPVPACVPPPPPPTAPPTVSGPTTPGPP